MTIEELLSNEEVRQREFPAATKSAYFAHAGVCPLPARVRDAIQVYAEDATKGDQEALLFPRQLQEGREVAAKLINAAPDEVSFVGPTSLGLSLVASGLRWRKGDNIIVYQDDYPSNVYPWMALASQGVQVRFLNVQSLGQIRPVDIEGQLDEQTRLVALASCHFISGYRIDIRGIGDLLRRKNVLFCLDAIQTLGAFPTTVENVDFLAADAHKWMLGPCGAGILYVRKELQEKLQPPIYGWHNTRCPNYVAQDVVQLKSGAARFEAGTHNLLGLVGIRAAMELLMEIGIEKIASELARKRARLVSTLMEKGFTVLHSSAPPVTSSGITSFYRPDADVPALWQKLSEAGVVTSLRTSRDGQRYIRVSPHFYNTDGELQRLIDLL